MPQSINPNIPFAAPSSSAIHNREQALEFLLGRINYERSPWVPYGQRQLKLDRMRQLLTRLGNPDVGLPMVHVAGTKGKGSTSAYLASILHAAGYDTGVFSSPHLERIEERFTVNGQPASGEELIWLVQRLQPVVQAMDQEAAARADSSLSPTYFELTTALALMYFAERQVDIVVLEVGLGGRLDATNVCQPVVTVITSISFDHTKQLGNTLAEIAAEKAGIIKPGVPVLCGPLGEEPRRVIADIAQQHGCRMLEAGRDFTHHYRAPQKLDLSDNFGQLDFRSQMSDAPFQLGAAPLRMLGDHQAANAALALATAVELRRQGRAISSSAMQEGLSQLTLPARAEVLGRRPTVILDVAHNVASVQALVTVLLQSFSCQRRTLLLAATLDKDIVGIVKELAPHFCRVVVTQYQKSPRAVPTVELGRIVRTELNRIDQREIAANVVEEPCPVQAWNLARAAARPDELICITGSFFIAAELRHLLQTAANTD